MVEPDAGGIERARIRPASDELADSVCSILQPVRAGQGKRINDGLKRTSGWIPTRRAGAHTSHAKVRHGTGHSCLWRNQAQPFIRDKEECFVLSVIQAGNLDRSAQCAAEIILPKCRLLHTKVVVEPV